LTAATTVQLSSGDIRLGQSVLLDGGSAAPRPEIRHCTVETDTFAAGFHAVGFGLSSLSLMTFRLLQASRPAAVAVCCHGRAPDCSLAGRATRRV